MLLLREFEEVAAEPVRLEPESEALGAMIVAKPRTELRDQWLPLVLRLAAAEADGVILNWLSPGDLAMVLPELKGAAEGFAVLLAYDPQAVEAAVAVECIAHMAIMSLELAPRLKPIEPELLDKHFGRKHGPGAYYGQDKA